MVGVCITSIPHLECENANIKCDKSRMPGSWGNLPEHPQSRHHSKRKVGGLYADVAGGGAIPSGNALFRVETQSTGMTP